MQPIDHHSRLTAEFTLSWKSAEAEHTEILRAHPVSVWRDLLEPELIQGLMGKTVGARAEVKIPAERFYAPYRKDKRIAIRPGRFQGTDARGNVVVPVPGRFYPQGMLLGVGGIYPETITPCRYLGMEGDRWFFDLNHPLAGYDLLLEMEILDVQPQEKERGGRCEHWLERIADDGPGMQACFPGAGPHLPAPADFRRQDNTPDQLFYERPRLVHHLDSTARAVIGARYARLIPGGAKVLDLMGSWDSHLPQQLELSGLSVLGMNREELGNNHRADETLVQDLNTTPVLPYGDSSFDAVICTASVEYLTDPLSVLAEVQRILRPNGLLAFAFSNRWFPPKVIEVWTLMHEFERLGWVAELTRATGGFTRQATYSLRGRPRPADDPYQELAFSDPVYMTWAWKS